MRVVLKMSGVRLDSIIKEKTMKLLLTGYVLAIFTILSAANPVLNGSFEAVDQKGAPKDWTWQICGGADAQISMDNTTATAGKNSLRLSNRTETASNVYGILHQLTKELRSNVEYELRVDVRGKNVTRMFFTVGKKWKTRLVVRNPSEKWTTYSCRFKLPPEEFDERGRLFLAIVIDAPAEAVWVDNLQIVPVASRTISKSEMQTERIWTIPFVSGIDFSKLRSIPAHLPVLKLPMSAANSSTGKMPDDFQGRAALAYDQTGLYFFIRINDQTPSVKSGEQLWSGDSVQVRIDQAGAAAHSATASDFEFGVAVDSSGQVKTWNWTDHRELPGVWTGFRDSAGWFAAGRIDWTQLNLIGFPEKRFFTFSMIANDADTRGVRRIYFLTHGIHDAKSAAEYFRAFLTDSAQTIAGVIPKENSSANNFSGELYLYRPPAGKLDITVEDSSGKSICVPAGEIAPESYLFRMNYQLPLDRTAPGKCMVRFQLSGQTQTAYTAEKLNAEQSAKWLDKAYARLEETARNFSTIAGPAARSEYVAMPLRVLEDYLPELRKNFQAAAPKMKEEYVKWVEMIRPEVDEVLNDLNSRLNMVRRGKVFPATWSYRLTPVTQNEHWPVTELTNSDGKSELRPAFFSGYGHFAPVARDSTRLSGYEVQLVQMEFGPRSLYPGKGKTREFEPDFANVGDFFHNLEKLQSAKMALCLLISPHYHPEWWLNSHPRLKLLNGTGFTRYNIADPAARDMMRHFVKDFLPEVKKRFPGLIHSICLLNEPIYNADIGEPAVFEGFTAHLREKFGNLANCNAVFDNHWPSWEDAAKAAGQNSAMTAEFIRYRRKVLGDWNAFLANEVKEAWPGIPVHSKIMMVESALLNQSQAVDPELFAHTGDYNGNDNTCYYNTGMQPARWPAIWSCRWPATMLGHELQISMAKKAVINAENHIIRDGETGPIPNDHIYTANFQQFISGASAVITWLWHPYRPETADRYRSFKDVLGNISLRPGNIIAQGLASLDVMRLGPEIRQFSRFEPKIAVLYSPTTVAFDAEGYSGKLINFYTESAFSGHRLRFLSESQLERGEYGRAERLFIIGASHIARNSFEALKKFPGDIFADVESLKFDEYNKTLPPLRSVHSLPEQVQAEQLKTEFFDPVEALPFPYTPTEGLWCRMVPEPGSENWLVNLVNYTRHPIPLKLTAKGTFQDLIADTPFSTDFVLLPLKPQLLRYTPASGTVPNP